MTEGLGLARLLGFRVVEATEDRAEIEWDVGPGHLQSHGSVHGGVHCAAVETAASIGAGRWLGDRGRVVGVANSTDFIRPVADGTLSATASPIHRGRSHQLWSVEIRDRLGRLVARGQVRLHNIAS